MLAVSQRSADQEVAFVENDANDANGDTPSTPEADPSTDGGQETI